VSTSGRPSTKRWSSVSQRRHRDGGEYVRSTGRGRYGTGCAGSDTYWSAPVAAVGGSNDRPPFSRKKRCFVWAAAGGQRSKLRHSLVPASNTVASGNFPSPSPLSQYANHRVCSARKSTPVARPNRMLPSAVAESANHCPWYQGTITRKFTPAVSVLSSAA